MESFLVKEPITTEPPPIRNIFLLLLMHINSVEHRPGPRRQDLRQLLLRVLRATVTEEQANRDTLEAEFFLDGIPQKVVIISRHQSFVITIEEKGRRATLDLHKVAEFKAFAGLRVERHALHF